MIINDTFNYYNQNIVDRHDTIMEHNANWVSHYNFMIGLSWNTESDIKLYEEEIAEYTCYDV